VSLEILIVNGTYALHDGQRVVGVVDKCNETQWGFYPLVKGETRGVTTCIALRYALEEALKFKPLTYDERGE
jgi:hypothetical protein